MSGGMKAILERALHDKIERRKEKERAEKANVKQPLRVGGRVDPRDPGHPKTRNEV